MRPQNSPPVSDRAPRTPQRPAGAPGTPAPKEPLWRDLVGDVLRRERLAQERTLKDVAEAARISMPYLSEVERGRKEASSEVLAAAARALGFGLADLLSLAQDELARHARSRVARTRTSPTARYGGLCLAA
nr:MULTISPECIES: helix-turn-helix transcriptional regulator [unclassified Streptomyces]